MPLVLMRISFSREEIRLKPVIWKLLAISIEFRRVKRQGFHHASNCSTFESALRCNNDLMNNLTRAIVSSLNPDACDVYRPCNIDRIQHSHDFVKLRETLFLVL
ncbi:uncharacterized protein LOC143148442 [Ptiloglossa arizonensis]|uniref:uncharacterized protein LOC143148442 n=1 Tax=Ptiloglossa arizonensis TaxID=3350558 RepID=UPI003F9EDAFF